MHCAWKKSKQVDEKKKTSLPCAKDSPFRVSTQGTAAADKPPRNALVDREHGNRKGPTEQIPKRR